MSLEFARDLRRKHTDAERKLWLALRSRRLAEAKFRRQAPLGSYIADFVSFEYRLVLEVDGGQHAEQQDHDAARTRWLEEQGFAVLRFWNNEVLQNLDGVLERIVEAFNDRPPLTRSLRSPPSPTLLLEDALRAARGEGLVSPDPGFGLYVHWPFCRSKCPYCDFNSYVRDAIDQAAWRAALVAELAHYAAETTGRRLTSIFFGGGTPSLMPPATAAAVIEAAARHFRFAPDIEITLEANPTSAEATAFAGFAAAGVNRLSLGVQALDDASLAFLGRQHTAGEALAAVALARRHVPRVSFDLIYARPGQTPEAWAAELAQALDEGPEHLSLYQLTLEENTVFHARARRGELALPPEPLQAALWEATQETLTAAGLPAYEISNHARPGAECRHNLTYWRYGDYLGIGPGAHGRLTLEGVKCATRQHRAPEAWLALVQAQGHATRTREPVGGEARLQELLLMGLRLTEGISRAAFRREAGAEPEALLPAERLTQLAEADYLRLDAERLLATAEGRQRLDAVLAHLLG